jgi:hypothetical protein
MLRDYDAVLKLPLYNSTQQSLGVLGYFPKKATFSPKYGEMKPSESR